LRVDWHDGGHGMQCVDVEYTLYTSFSSRRL
jgi:hypothetical protein